MESLNQEVPQNINPSPIQTSENTQELNQVKKLPKWYNFLFFGLVIILIFGLIKITSLTQPQNPNKSPQITTTNQLQNLLPVTPKIESQQELTTLNSKVTTTIFNETVFPTKDFSNVAYIYLDNNRQNRLILNGKEEIVSEPETQARLSTGFVFSNDGKSYAYNNLLTNMVIVNDKSFGPYSYVEGIVFSKDGKHFAFAAEKPDTSQENWIINIDGKEQFYQNINQAFTPTFSSDSQRTAYLVATGNSFPGTSFYVIDGATGPTYDAIIEGEFSPDSSKFIYIAKEDNQEFIIVDGFQQTSRFDSIKYLDFSKNSKDIYYSARNGTQNYIYRNDQLIAGPYEYENQHGYPIPFTLSPDESTLAVWPQNLIIKKINNNKSDIILSISTYTQLENVTLNSDGSTVAYIGFNPWRRSIVINGKEQEVIDLHNSNFYGRFIFSNDGKKLMYRSPSMGWLVNGIKIASDFKNIWSTTFSDDSSQINIVAEKDGKVIKIIESL